MDAFVGTDALLKNELSPLRLFEIINDALNEAYRIADKEVRKKAIVRLPLPLRATLRGKDIVDHNIGRYLETQASWEVIYRAVQRFYDQYCAANDLPLSSYDEVWDHMAPIIRTVMLGFIYSRQLRPPLSDEDWLFDLVS